MYSIIRTKKLKNFGAIARSARHTFRETPTPNAAPNMGNLNRVVGAKNTSELIAAFKKTLPEKRRVDAVLCIEYMITASPESFKRHGGNLDDLGNGYFKDALSWLKDRHGAANVLCAAVHLDESTPHLVAYVTPLTKAGNLSAREFLGGPKMMRELQDSFHSSCGASRGLLRGVKGSKAKHEEVAAFYRALTTAGEAPKLTASDYVAKALGHETEAWKKAESISAANALGVGLERRKRKAGKSREKALDRREAEAASAERDLRNRTEQLNSREISLHKKQQEVSSLAPQLEEERARANSMQRIINRHIELREEKFLIPGVPREDFFSPPVFGR